MNKKKLLKIKPRRLTISFQEEDFELYDYVIKKANRTERKYSAIIRRMIRNEKLEMENG